MSEENVFDALWVEKYRPKCLEDLVLEEKQRNFLSRSLEEGSLPHLMFLGPPGSGKTCTCQILESYIIKDKMDIMRLHGKRDVTIDTVRGDVTEFVKSPPMSSSHKIIFIDEFDGSSLAAQQELRSTIEQYAETTRFMVTGNYSSAIIPALFSRFQTFYMDTISEEFAMNYCKSVLEKEEIQYEEDKVKLVVESLLPDVRQILNTIQQNTNTTDKVFEGVDKKELENIENKIVGLVIEISDELKKETPNEDKINSNISEIHNSLNEEEPSYDRVYQNLFYSEIPAWGKIVINKYAKNHKNCFLPIIHFTAMLYELVQNGYKFQGQFS